MEIKMKTVFTTLCYIKKGDELLMLHRISKNKPNDFNKDKWIGVGGHFEDGESPDECLVREVREETGLTLTSYLCRGVLTFIYSDICEYTFLYTADSWIGSLTDCDEGKLEWINASLLEALNLFEGDLIFLDLIAQNHPFFSLKLQYDGSRLTKAVLDGKSLELLDITDMHGRPTGLSRARSLVHLYGTPHRTAHVWIARKGIDGFELLLQRRSPGKDSWPNCYDISSAGHIPAGEEPLASAIRELYEELGIRACENDLCFMFMHTGHAESRFHGRPFKNTEVSFSYLYTKSVDESTLCLQESEVSAVCWIPLEKCIAAAESLDPSYCLWEDELTSLRSFLQTHCELLS